MKLSVIASIALAAGVLAVPQPALEEKRQPEAAAAPILGLVEERDTREAAEIFLSARQDELASRAPGIGDLLSTIITTLDTSVSSNVANIRMSTVLALQ